MISVIIPTYNRATFLEETIHSVLDQDYFVLKGAGSFEFLVIDDGSTDNTKDIVRSFGNKMKYHFQEHKGVSAARNLGLDLAQGDYIAFLDSDDLWKKEKISIQMSYMNAFPKTMVCYTEEIWMRHGVFVNPKKKHRKYSGWIFDRVLSLCLISLSSALFRSEVFAEIGKFDEELLACEDYDFGIRLALKHPVHFLPKPLIIKRGGHADQLSRQYWGMDRFRVKALEKTLSLNLTPDQEMLVKQEIVRKCQILAVGFEKRNNKAEARKYLSLIDKHRPEEKGQKREEK
jgi:glycosyltransferase involved in cell wall biosynthesis